MYQRVLLAAFLTASALFTAHVTNLMVAHALTRNIPLHRAALTTDHPPASTNNAEQLVEEILTSGVFGGPETAAEKLVAGDIPASENAALLAPNEPPIDAAKKVKLVGTVIGEDKISMAVIEEVSTKKQTLYRLHDSIPNVGQVAQIRKDAILLRQGRRQELLGLEYAISAAQPTSPVVAPPAVPNTLQ